MFSKDGPVSYVGEKERNVKEQKQKEENGLYNYCHTPFKKYW